MSYLGEVPEGRRGLHGDQEVGGSNPGIHIQVTVTLKVTVTL